MKIIHPSNESRLVASVWVILCGIITSPLLPLQVQSQDFTLSFSEVGVAGGKSTGTDYTLTATIGKPTSNTLNGGDYSLTGDLIINIFYESVRLEIIPNGDSILLLWPSRFVNCIAETRPQSSTGEWIPIPWSPIIEGDSFVVNVPLTNKTQFFRLTQ